jgi:DNA-directed RNA polymerase specialized sigma24 family protein
MYGEHEVVFDVENYALKIAYFDEILSKIKSSQLKLILILKCIGYPYREIGDIVKLSESTVRRRHLRVLRLLKKENII